jgi:hypothetical protein
MARPKGVPNRKTQALIDICEEFGLNPFVEMIMNYKELESPRERFDAAEKLAQYIYPKRKAIEVSTDEDKGFTIVVKDYTSKQGD